MNANKTDRIIVAMTQWLGMALLAGFIIWMGLYFRNKYQFEDTNDAQVDAYLSPINVKVGGYIQKINFRDNQTVQRGDTLVMIETNEFQLKKEEAEAELMSSRARLGVLNASEETQQRNIDVISAGIPGAKAKLEQQQQEYSRYQKLLKDESATQQKFENVQATLAVIQSDYDGIIASLKAAQSKLNDLIAERSSIDADIKTKEVLLARQQLDVNYTVITAPFSGQLGKKTIQEGQLVQPGQTLAFLTNESEEKWIVANFKETQISSFKIGQLAKVEVDAFPGEQFTGSIESLSPTTGSRYSLLPPDNATGNFVKVIQRIPVRIKLTNSKEKLSKLSAGMNANVYIQK